MRGAAPAALTGLPRPDAVFVGGGAAVPGVLERCWDAVAPAGRLVAHAATPETESELVQRFSRHGGELVRLSVHSAGPLGSFTGSTPVRAVTQWFISKPAGGPA